MCFFFKRFNSNLPENVKISVVVDEIKYAYVLLYGLRYNTKIEWRVMNNNFFWSPRLSFDLIFFVSSKLSTKTQHAKRLKKRKQFVKLEFYVGIFYVFALVELQFLAFGSKPLGLLPGLKNRNVHVISIYEKCLPSYTSVQRSGIDACVQVFKRNRLMYQNINKDGCYTAPDIEYVVLCCVRPLRRLRSVVVVRMEFVFF